ncbi:RNA polymerase sigma factor [Allomuricauda sp. CP2A]|uniref:RNA polymerase sigma factor n=1 Tax=Allomuricauda sp. CP2A TaxID=1848189 RepID=UPI0008371E14|nr:sigma-70 family RNA polymerase sigma factor [Muricauda sp. CP2A]
MQLKPQNKNQSEILGSDALASLSKEDNQAIWKDFKAGDEKAFILLYEQHANMLYGYGCRFTADNELVKDCLQDFFVYLREKREGLGDPASVKFYLLKAFKRRVLDYLRKGKKEKEKSQEVIRDGFYSNRMHETVFIQQQDETKLLNLEKALKSLNTKEREAIYYFYYQNLSYEQIAEILDFSYISSARRLIYRSLKKMKAIL